MNRDLNTLWVFTQDQTDYIQKMLEEHQLLIEEVNYYYERDSLVSFIANKQINIMSSQQESIDILSRLSELSEQNSKKSLTMFESTRDQLMTQRRISFDLEEDLKKSNRRLATAWKVAAGATGVAAVATLVAVLVSR